MNYIATDDVLRAVASASVMAENLNNERMIAEMDQLEAAAKALCAEYMTVLKVLGQLTDAVGAMKVPQTPEEAALQITITLGPLYNLSRLLIAQAEQPKPENPNAHD